MITMNDPAQHPFFVWLDDRTQPVPPVADEWLSHGQGQYWLNDEHDGTITVWCWHCTTGPEANLARIPVAAEDYEAQMNHVLTEHPRSHHPESAPPPALTAPRTAPQEAVLPAGDDVV